MKSRREFKVYLEKVINILKNKKFLRISGVVFLFFAIVGSALFFNYYNSPLKIGFITDIHAGDQKYREEDKGNVVLPANFEENVKKALGGIGKADLIVVLGDNVNRPSRKNMRKLLEITAGHPMIWVKGNHDKLLHFNEILSKDRYYSVDKKDWRIIVLDNSATYPEISGIDDHGRGFIDEGQLNWLREKLKTNKKIIIAMHIPMFVPGNPGVIRKDYEYLEEMLVQSGNVKHIFSGHWHVYDEEIEKNGIIHHLVPSVSLESNQGFYKKFDFK